MVCRSRTAIDLCGVTAGIRVGVKRQPWCSGNAGYSFNLQLGT